MKIDCGVASVALRRFAVSILASETLGPRPRFQQRPIYREVLVTEQTVLAQLPHHAFEKRAGNVPCQQPVPVLAEHRRHPHLIVHVQPHKPPEQNVVIELLHQQPFAPDRVQHLQQQRPQQLLRRNRWPSVRRVQPRKLARQLSHHRIHQFAYRAQRMIPWYPLLRRKITEHRSLLSILSAHRLFSSRYLFDARPFPFVPPNLRLFQQPARASLSVSEAVCTLSTKADTSSGLERISTLNGD